MLYLASRSPRRNELLRQIRAVFRPAATNIEEKEYPQLTPREKCIRRSKDKCIRAVNSIRERGMEVIAADTVVDLDGRTLDKPRNAEQAGRMINRLSGRTHTVHTAVSVYKAGVMYTFCEDTLVTFGDVPEQAVKEYVLTDEPYDKAGGYAIQGAMGRYITSTDGDRNNVVGLPLTRLEKLLDYLDTM